MEIIQLDELVYTYPEQDNDSFQTIITSKKEFNELASSIKERIPVIGEPFNHQKLIKRFMIQYDKVILVHKTGTGKTCAAITSAEQFKQGVIGATSEYIDEYMSTKRTEIKKIIVLTSKSLIKEFKYELACKCTKGDYITELVKKSKTEKERKSNLTREINKFYEIKTHTTFAREILEKNYSDDQLKDMYNGTFFIIDEAQKLRTGTTEDNDQQEQFKTYNTLWKLFHIIQRSKIMLLTATPMVDTVNEIAPLMNLILPLKSKHIMPLAPNNDKYNGQLPLNIDYNNVTLEQMEPYFRGKISYVRELETGAIPQYIGNKLDVEYQIGEKKYPGQSIVTAVKMEKLQEDGYIELLKKGGNAFHINELQASNFIFPDKSSGMDGYNKFVISSGKDIYKPTPELFDWISNPTKFKQLSNKYYTIISLTNQNKGNTFCYTDFVNGSGAILLGLCFESYGYERFIESSSIFISEDVGKKIRPLCENVDLLQNINRPTRIQPKLRYALLTGETPDTVVETILSTFNSNENKHGDYIKVLIGSRVARIGINLSNVLNVFIVNPGWNQSNTYQAISRAIRSTSHISLLQEERQNLIQKGQNPDTAKFNVNIYQMASITDLVDEPVDIKAYRFSETKDIEIKRMERIMKQVAFDCQIHYKRNVRPSDIDYSSVCDYDICQYTCFNPPPDQLDYSSYDILYSTDLINNAINIIITLFHKNFTLTYDQLYKYFPSYSFDSINDLLNYIIDNKILITNNSGESFYLLNDNGILKLSTIKPPNSSFSKDFLVDLMTDLIILLEKFPLLSYQQLYKLLPSYKPSYINSAIYKIIIDKLPIIDRYGYTNYLREDNNSLFIQRDYPTITLSSSKNQYSLSTYSENLIAIQKTSLSDYVSDINLVDDSSDISRLKNIDPNSPNFISILDSLNISSLSLLLESVIIDYYLHNNTSDYNITILNHFSNFYFIFNEPVSHLQNLIEERARKSKGPGRKSKDPSKLKIKRLTLQSLSSTPVFDSDTELVYIHYLFSLSKTLTAYNVISKSTKAEGKLRILKPSEQLGWRDTNPYETVIYNEMIQLKNLEKISPFEQQFDIYGVIYKSDNKLRIRDKTREKLKERKTLRDLTRGLKCDTWKKPDLIDVFWHLSIPPDPNLPISYSREQLINYLTKENVPSDTRILTTWSLDRLSFYYKWLSLEKDITFMCQFLQQKLQDLGRLYIE